MATKKCSNRTAATRQMTISDFAEVTKSTPEKSLTFGKRSTGGRNNQGRITTRFRGGGVKRLLRKIDFKRDKRGMPATVSSIEYDPNRTARIALLVYEDGEKRYILSPVGLNVGDVVFSGSRSPLKPGNALPLAEVPAGMAVHNVELVPGKGAAIARSAGQLATVRGVEGTYAQVRLPSGEVRLIHATCYCTIGQVGNTDHNNVVLGKAGKSRYKGKRPHVRGVVQNPVDHPMGGGEGRSSGGQAKSPWGQLAKGFRTRKKKKGSSKFIVQRRKK